jgi:branched-chain amino acid transport system substrate-binding protein
VRHAVALLAALSLTAAAACGGGGSVDADSIDSSGAAPIRIGLIASLTGNDAPLGSETRQAVELAVDQLNAEGGVLGRKVEILVKDDRTLSDEAVRGFNDIKGGEVTAVIGPALSNAALAVEPLTQQEGIPYLSLSPAAEQLQPIRPYVFVAPALASMYAERFLQYFRFRHITTLAIAHDTTSGYAVTGAAAIRELAADYGVRVVRDETFENTTTDFSPTLAAVRNSDAEAFLFWGTGAPGVNVTEQYAAADMKVPLMLTGAQASRLWTDPVGEKAAEGVTVASTIGVVGDHLPAGPHKRIIDRMDVPYEQQYGHAPPPFAQDGYSAALLLFAAIKKAGGTDGEKIQKALESMDLVTPNGRFRYSPTNHSGLSPDYISVNTVRDGRFVPTDWAGEQLTKTVAAD